MHDTAPVCATWNDQGKVQIWNLNNCWKVLEELDTFGGDQNGAAKNRIGGGVRTGRQSYSKELPNERPLYSFPGHNCEGFALDWSSQVPGRLASGDNRKRIFVWNMGEGGVWNVDQRPFLGHTGSVEDIQWSPQEDSLFASCGSDGTLRLWDVRAGPNEACVCVVEGAHSADVNVISWNTETPLLVSGGDDNALKVWDLKTISYKTPVAQFRHHKKPITSVAWSPHDGTVFAASGEDDQTTVWDLALEKDEEPAQNSGGGDVAPQLLFIHMGQKEVKEVRWHPQLKGFLTSTALDGFNIFSSINM